jgi:hypothetical protein
VTEIPEHLLKRSRERRTAMGGESGAPAPTEGASSTPAAAAATPATRPAAAAPAPKAPAPRPVPAYVAAARNRRKIPVWISPVLALLPIWMFLFVNAMTQQPRKVTGPLAEGATVFNKCASCHAADGSGGTGYALYNGEVHKSFPNIADQIRFIYNGNRPYVGKTYTPADREGGPHVGGVKGVAGAMPAWGSKAGGELTDAELLAVVCHERFGLAPAELETTYADEFETWCAPEGANWVAVEEGGFDAIKLDVAATVAIPSPVAAAG